MLIHILGVLTARTILRESAQSAFAKATADRSAGNKLNQMSNISQLGPDDHFFDHTSAG